LNDARKRIFLKLLDAAEAFPTLRKAA